MNISHHPHTSTTRTRLVATMTGLLTAAALVGLSGCGGSKADTESISFPYAADALDISNQNDNMPITVRENDKQEIVATVTTTTVGKTATDPGWALRGTTLDLGNPCSKGYVGLCEGSYSIMVPTGTRVRINGVDAAVRR